MKANLILFILLACTITAMQGCGSGWVATTNDSGNAYQNSNYQENYTDQQYNVDALNSYGVWQDNNAYGRVWRPSVSPGWQPFTNGHWANDGTDWVWVSNEPFGWMVYHHGSWEYTPDYGWIWIPQQDAWSPACVQWVYYGDQVAWAPRRPQNRNWSEPWEQNNMHPWVVVPMEDFNRENVASYRMRNIPIESNQQIIQRRQPDIGTIRGRVNEPIRTVKVERSPVQRNPIRNDVIPPIDRKPINITPPVERNPKDALPPVDRKPTDIKPPIDRNPTDLKPPVVINPRNVTPPVRKNQKTITPNVNKNPRTVSPQVKPNNRIQVAPRVKQADKTPKKVPVDTKRKTAEPDSKTKDRTGNGDK